MEGGPRGNAGGFKIGKPEKLDNGLYGTQEKETVKEEIRI